MGSPHPYVHGLHAVFHTLNIVISVRSAGVLQDMIVFYQQCNRLTCPFGLPRWISRWIQLDHVVPIVTLSNCRGVVVYIFRFFILKELYSKVVYYY